MRIRCPSMRSARRMCSSAGCTRQSYLYLLLLSTGLLLLSFKFTSNLSLFTEKHLQEDDNEPLPGHVSVTPAVATSSVRSATSNQMNIPDLRPASIGIKRFGHLAGTCGLAKHSNNKTLVLAWDNDWFGQSLVDVLEGFAACPDLGCEMTSERALVGSASALLFHVRSNKFKRPSQLPQMRKAEQAFVFLISESPAHTTMDSSEAWFRSLSYFFNLTMTYRRDADAPRPYGAMQLDARIDSQSEEYKTKLSEHMKQIRPIVKGKTKLAVWVSSNCYVPSKREQLVEELKQYMSVDVWGLCGNASACPLDQTSYKNNQLSDSQCNERIVNEYKFVFAFENSICADYVTEKLWRRAKLAVVPVVLKRSVLSGWLPDSAFIAVDDFESAERLAEHLKMLDNNADEYEKYLTWVPFYKDIDWSYYGFCGLCRALRDCDRVAQTYSSIYHWWYTGAECSDGYRFAVDGKT